MVIAPPLRCATFSKLGGAWTTHHGYNVCVSRKAEGALAAGTAPALSDGLRQYRPSLHFSRPRCRCLCGAGGVGTAAGDSEQGDAVQQDSCGGQPPMEVELSNENREVQAPLAEQRWQAAAPNSSSQSPLYKYALHHHACNSPPCIHAVASGVCMEARHGYLSTSMHRPALPQK